MVNRVGVHGSNFTLGTHLSQTLRNLPGVDNTEIGEKGCTRDLRPGIGPVAEVQDFRSQSNSNE